LEGRKELLLRLTDVRAGYGRLDVLRGVSLEVDAGTIVALLGPNGSGKTTTLKAIMGALPISGGDIHFSKKSIANKPTHRIVREGITLVPQGRQLFPDMTVMENLELGGIVGARSGKLSTPVEEILSFFPRLRERAYVRAGLLSGGEQQMVAIGRAMMAGPQIMLLDEPTAGLAPLIVEEIAQLMRQLHRRGDTILLVEQNVAMALAIADHVCVLNHGAITHHGSIETMGSEERIISLFLGHKDN
jgi:branched-chain amino acid transport system ATP-binding protein